MFCKQRKWWWCGSVGYQDLFLYKLYSNLTGLKTSVVFFERNANMFRLSYTERLCLQGRSFVNLCSRSINSNGGYLWGGRYGETQETPVRQKSDWRFAIK